MKKFCIVFAFLFIIIVTAALAAQAERDGDGLSAHACARQLRFRRRSGGQIRGQGRRRRLSHAHCRFLQEQGGGDGCPLGGARGHRGGGGEGALRARFFVWGARFAPGGEFPTRVYEGVTLEAGVVRCAHPRTGRGGRRQLVVRRLSPLCFSGAAEGENVQFRSRLLDIIRDFSRGNDPRAVPAFFWIREEEV